MDQHNGELPGGAKYTFGRNEAANYSANQTTGSPTSREGVNENTGASLLLVPANTPLSDREKWTYI